MSILDTESQEVDVTDSIKKISYIKTHGQTSTDWLEFKVNLLNSNLTAQQTIRLTVGTSLYGPFSYVKWNDTGETGLAGTPTSSPDDCYVSVFTTEH